MSQTTIDLSSDRPTVIYGDGAVINALDDENAPGGHILEADLSGQPSTYQLISLAAHSSPDVEVLALIDRDAEDDHIIGVFLRGDGGSAYFAGLRNNPDDATIRKMTNGERTTLVNAPHSITDTSQPAWVRAQAIGSTLRVKAWAADLGVPDFGYGAEPAGWQAETTDTTHTDAGSLGLVLGITATPARVFELMYLSAGTNGDKALGPNESVAEPAPEPTPEPEPEPVPDNDCIECPPGPKGDKGDKGPQGPKGEKGDKGDPGSGDGTTTVINVVGRHVSNVQMGIEATSDPVKGRERLQAFVDNVASDNVTGFIDTDYWAIDKTIVLPEGLRLVGRGMWATTIDCPTTTWALDKFYAMRMTASRNNAISKAPYLADFGVIGADKTRRDDGPLVRLDGVEDALVERMRFEDPSSYGLFVSGYGIGEYTNEIDSDMWNSTHRVTVRDCLALRGQIGFGTEGGAENVLFERCAAIGNNFGGLGGLHAYRSASGYGVTYHKCLAKGYRNGFLLDRHRQITIDDCFLDEVRNGVALGSFYSSDPETSTATRITGNKIRCNLPDGGNKRSINDSYISSRTVNGVIIADNLIYEGDMLLLRSKRLNVHGNVDMGGGNKIRTGKDATGMVHDNLMIADNDSPDVHVANNIAP